VSWGSLIDRHVEDVLSENQIETEAEIEVEREGRQSGKYKKICATDPDATMATNAHNRRLEPAYKQHAAVDDKAGDISKCIYTTLGDGPIGIIGIGPGGSGVTRLRSMRQITIALSP
jgi:hypothetical protein